MLQFACSRLASVEEFLASDCSCSLDEIEDADLIEALLDQASDIVTLLSGLRIHGVCTRTVYPIGDTDCWVAILEGQADWYQGVLLRGPAPSVASVVIDGVTLDPSEYVIVRDNEMHVLRRIDEPWPASNDPFTTDGMTWTITYTFGRPADYITKMAALEVACELMTFAKAGKTKIAPGVYQANIQGASLSIRSLSEVMAGNAEFIPALARFLGIYAPDGRSRSGVWSPETEGAFTFVEVIPQS